MKLTKQERLLFSNQLMILEKLYPDEAKYYAQHRKSLEDGYSLHYDWMFEHICDELSIDECKQVLHILDMYRAITFSYDKLEDKSAIESLSGLKFRGFDGNYETALMSYTKYFIMDLERFQELKYGQEVPDLNSHTPMLASYLKMLAEWKKFEGGTDLSADEIKHIIGS